MAAPNRALTPAEKAAAIRQRGQTFLTEDLFPRLSEEGRTAIQQHVIDNPQILDLVGQAVIRQQEASRVVNENLDSQRRFDALYDANKEWWQKNSAVVERAKALVEARGGDPDTLTFDQEEDDMDGQHGQHGQNGRRIQSPGPATRRPGIPATPAPEYVTPETLATALRTMEQNALAFGTVLPKIAVNHFKEFGEVLDTQELVSYASEAGVNVVDAYDRLVGDRRQARQQADFDARITAAREEGRLAGRAEASGHGLPVPSTTEAATLAALRTGGQPGDYTVAAAAQELVQMIQQSGE